MKATSVIWRGASLGAAKILTACVVLLMAVPAFAGPSTDFVKKKSSELFNVVNQPVGKARTAAMKKEVRGLVNYEELASRALGAHWKARSAAEKKKFIGLLEQLVELNYADRFKEKSGDKNYEVKYLGEKVRESTKQAIVKTSVSYGGETFTFDYKLVEGGGGFTIYDIVFDDISLEETYRESYVPIIDKEGWASLIGRMESKLKELRSR
jgi:phospholipid transport system substrate-binding protein